MMMAASADEIIIDAVKGGVSGDASNDAKLMEVIYAQGWSKSPLYMTKREAEVVTKLKLETQDATIKEKIVDLSALQYFVSLTNLIRLTLPKLQKVILPNCIKYMTFDYNHGFGGLSQNPITLTDVNWLMSFREYCGTKIGARFFGTTSYTKSIILNGIKVEGDIVIPDTFINQNGIETNITIVGANFCDCTDITGVTLPKHCTTLGFDAFRNCTNLKNVVLNEGLKTIDKNALKNVGIEELTIPNTVTSILGSYGNSAISDCPNLKKIKISSALTEIQYSVFANNKKLEDFDFNNAQIVKIGYNFLVSSSINRIILPNSVTTIDGGFCRNCKLLTHVELGENVTSIGGTFLYQSKCDKVLVIKAIVPPIIIDVSYFLVSSRTTAIYVPDESVEAYKAADIWSTFADIIKPLSEYTE